LNWPFTPNPASEFSFQLDFKCYALYMKFIFALLLVTSGAMAQIDERCNRHQIQRTLKISKKFCLDNVNEFAARSSASCHVSESHSNFCRAQCKDADKKIMASLKVELSSDCTREQVVYKRMAIKYFK